MATDLAWTASGGHLLGVVDVELTNRCNASCSFCPRDLTPHQGVMTPAVFQQVRHRVLEFREAAAPALAKPPTVSFCGLGEQLLNRDVIGFVADLHGAGLNTVVNTNAALLDQERGRALLDAGIDSVVINGGELDEDYEQTYRLPFGRTRDNVARFVDLAGDRCRIFIVLVDHRGDPAHVEEVEHFWRSVGVFRFFRLDLLNRAGSLSVPTMTYDEAERPVRATELWADATDHAVCAAPFHFPFIGYDGQYYLCSSDWQKEVSAGNVFESSIIDVMVTKGERVASRSPICQSCNHDPLNRLTDVVRAIEQGRADEADLEALVARLASQGAELARALDLLGVAVPDPTRAATNPAARSTGDDSSRSWADELRDPKLAVPVRLEKVAPAGHERDLLQYFYLCGLWCLTTYSACDLRCSYCVSYAQGASDPRWEADEVVAQLRRELAHLPSDAPIAVGSLIDCYPRAEDDHGVTRLALAELLDQGRRLIIVTKGLTIRRDLDLLAGRGDQVSVLVSLPSLDDRALTAIEPHVAPASERLALIRELHTAGVPVELHAQPWVPGLTDAEAMIDLLGGEIPICFGPLNVQSPTQAGTALARRWTQPQINRAYLDEFHRIGPRDGVIWQLPPWLDDLDPTEVHDPDGVVDPEPAAAPTSPRAANHADTLRRLVRAFDEARSALIVLEVLSPFVVGHDLTGGLSDPRHPRSGQFLDPVGTAAAALGHPRFEIERLESDDDQVRATIRVSGQLDRPLLGREPTGQAVAFRVDTTYRFDGNGLIVELWQHDLTWENPIREGRDAALGSLPLPS